MLPLSASNPDTSQRDVHPLILVVDDEPRIIRFVRINLEMEGFRVIEAANGLEAVDQVREKMPDAVLLDVSMPEMDGFETLRMIRELSSVPVIMLTVRSSEEDKVRGLDLGADDYITKPFSLRELMSRIRAMLRRAYGELSSAQSDTLYAADLAIDQMRGQVRRGEHIILLTPIEFRLLVYLARNSGQALSRAQIVDAVWGFSPDMESEKAVNVHIRRLREKVEPDPANPSLILTVPGVGYRLVA